ncbi:hypothetical protein Vadar_031887 [Vaccinium darrowii]|uniref:Uncharacterized protein n=1 Tax=Vaccinium darrowii TaxID=229202 RepID=A0ACB7XE46_9ERIC|nr:hypothetical protein Vadar_031887 [Vaccinium darrowii]
MVYSDKDCEDIKFGVDNEVDFYAVSFVKDADVAHELKDYLKRSNADIHVIVKIEKVQTIPNRHSIISASDGVSSGPSGIYSAQWLLVEIWEGNFQLRRSLYCKALLKRRCDNTWNNNGVCYSSLRVQIWTRRITALPFRIVAIKNLSEIVEDQQEIPLVVAPAIRATTNDTQPMQAESSSIKKSDSKTDMEQDKIEEKQDERA